MENKKLLKEAYKLLIPIVNKILFDTENPPTKELIGFKLSNEFIKSYKENKKDNNSIIMRLIEFLYKSIFNFNTEQKKQIIGIVYDNTELINVTYLTSPKHRELNIEQFLGTIISDYLTENLSAEVIILLNYHLMFIYEIEFKNGYISENEYIELIKNVSRRTSFI